MAKRPLGERKTVLLVQPAVKQVMKPRIPINLLPLAFTLREAGFKPKVVDARLKDFNEFEIDWEDVLMVGISSYTGPMIFKALEIAKAIKEKDLKIPVVWGGIHPSLDPVETARHKLVDFVVRRDGEETIVELAKATQKGKGFEKILGITYRKGGKLVSNPDRPRFDLNRIPILPYDLVDMQDYNLVEFPMNTSRGCPFACIFCYNRAYNGPTYSFKSAKNVVKEIEHVLGNWGNKVETIGFSDDNFFMNKKRVEEICNALIKKKIKVKWMSTIRADYIRKYSLGFLRLIRKSGCDTLAFGAESGSNRILKVIGKATTVEDNLAAVKKLRKAGIEGRISLVWGTPTETYGESIQSLELIKKMRKADPKAVINGFFISTIYPNTRLFEKAKELVPNFKMPKSLEDWGSWGLYQSGFQPWLDKKYVKQMMTASEIVRFQFFKQMKPENYFKNPLTVLAVKLAEAIMDVSASFRWKHNFYKYGYEWKLFTWLKFRFIGIG